MFVAGKLSREEEKEKEKNFFLAREKVRRAWAMLVVEGGGRSVEGKAGLVANKNDIKEEKHSTTKNRVSE